MWMIALLFKTHKLVWLWMKQQRFSFFVSPRKWDSTTTVRFIDFNQFFCTLNVSLYQSITIKSFLKKTRVQVSILIVSQFVLERMFSKRMQRWTVYGKMCDAEDIISRCLTCFMPLDDHNSGDTQIRILKSLTARRPFLTEAHVFGINFQDYISCPTFVLRLNSLVHS